MADTQTAWGLSHCLSQSKQSTELCIRCGNNEKTTFDTIMLSVAIEERKMSVRVRASSSAFCISIFCSSKYNSIVFELNILIAKFSCHFWSLKWHTSGDYVMIFAVQCENRRKGDREVYGIGWRFKPTSLVARTFIMISGSFSSLSSNSPFFRGNKWNGNQPQLYIWYDQGNVYEYLWPMGMTWHCTDMKNSKFENIQHSAMAKFNVPFAVAFWTIYVCKLI